MKHSRGTKNIQKTARDSHAMQRMRRNHRGYRVGEDHHRAKLNDEAVSWMRELRAQGLSYRAIAERVGCSLWTARDICDFRTRPV